MIKRFKRWLYNKFLPAWCKEDLLTDNARLAATVAEQRQEIARLNAYIEGMESGMRTRNKIIINNGVRQ